MRKVVGLGFALGGFLIGGAVGAYVMLRSLTGVDEVSEQARAFRYMQAQAKHWEQPQPGGPQSATWSASVDLALQDRPPQVSETEIKRDFADWELLERCATNGVAKAPEGTGEQRPRSLTPEAAARFIRAMRGDKGCSPCTGG